MPWRPGPRKSFGAAGDGTAGLRGGRKVTPRRRRSYHTVEKWKENHLKTEVTRGEGHQVTLKVEAGPEDLEGILEQTYKELGRTVRIPGFRKGKVPRAVIDSHLGSDYVRSEALRNGLPTLYVMGVQDSGIMPVSDPEINVLDMAEDGAVTFEARVDVKPEVEVRDYKGIEVDRPEVEVTEDDVKRALDEARERFATLEVVETRPVQQGDFVMFDYKVFTDGVPIEGSSGTDRMTEVGSGDFLPGFDEQLVGARKGDIIDVVINFPPDYGERALAGKPATFRTMIKETKHKVLPELNDDLAREVSSFETLDEFKDDLRERIKHVKEVVGERTVREQVIKALADKTYIDLPESMIQHQVDREIEEMSDELSDRGITLDDYLGAIKGTRYQLEKAIRERVVDGLKAELSIEAVADAEGIEISEDDAEDYVRENALQAGGDPESILEDIKLHGRLPAIKANLRLSRAIELLAENAVYKDGGAVGRPAEEAAAAETPEEAAAGEPDEAPEKAEVEDAGDQAAGGEVVEGATGSGTEKEED